MNFNSQQVILACATAIGAYGGFPNPPKAFNNIIKNELVQWMLVWILIYQGGGNQNIQLVTIVTIVMYVIHKMLSK
jgi:hypothetical protein